MAGITALGTCSYAGYTFDGAAKATMRVEYIKDEAGRTIIYKQHTLTVKATIAADPTCNQTIESIREALGTIGGRLEFSNRGFGETFVVGDGGTPDVKWGPVPTMLAWEPVGGNRAAELEWQVVACIPCCEQSPGQAGDGLLALNYDVTFTHDRNGDTTRTISGHLVIPSGRNGRQVTKSADAYLERLKVEPIPGYSRDITRRTSADRCRLDFTITDSQIPSRNAFPPNVTMASGRQRVRWNVSKGQSATIRSSINVEFNPKANTPPSLMWQLFLDVAYARLNQAEAAGKWAYIEELELEEDIFGRPCNFSLSWYVLMELKDIASQNGLWKPVDENTFLELTGLYQPLAFSWDMWKVSMEDVQGYYGRDKLKAAPDVIVDLCGGDIRQTIKEEPIQPSTGAPTGARNLQNKLPPPKCSYMHYRSRITPRRHSAVTRQRILQRPPPAENKGGDPKEVDVKFPPGGFGEGSGGGAGQYTPDVLQEGAQPSYGFTYSGEAIRVGYPTPRPAVVSIGGYTVKELTGHYEYTVIGTALGIDIYGTKWVLDYVADQSPGLWLSPSQQ